jgi:hypothetical protein
VSLLSPEESEEKREKDAQNDRGGQREVEAEVSATDCHIARQPEERHAEHDQQAEGGDAETDEDQESTHSIKAKVSASSTAG